MKILCNDVVSILSNSQNQSSKVSKKLSEKILLFFVLTIVAPHMFYCKRSAPTWASDNIYIKHEKEKKGYAVSVASIYPSTALGQIKCENENQTKMEAITKGEIEPEIVKVLKITDKQKERKFQDLMEKMSKGVVEKLKDKIITEEVFIDKEKGVIYCKSYIILDEEFYSAILEVMKNVIREKEFEILFTKEEDIENVLRAIEERVTRAKRVR